MIVRLRQSAVNGWFTQVMGGSDWPLATWRLGKLPQAGGREAAKIRDPAA